MKITADKVSTVNTSRTLATAMAVETSLTKAAAPMRDAGRTSRVTRASGKEIAAATQAVSKAVDTPTEATRVDSSPPIRATKANSKVVTAADTGQRLAAGNLDTVAAVDTGIRATIVLDKNNATRASRSKAAGVAMSAMILGAILKVGIADRDKAVTAAISVILIGKMYGKAAQISVLKLSTLTTTSGAKNRWTPWMRTTATGAMIATKSSLTSSRSGVPTAMLNAAATRTAGPVLHPVSKARLEKSTSNPLCIELCS